MMWMPKVLIDNSCPILGEEFDPSVMGASSNIEKIKNLITPEDNNKNSENTKSPILFRPRREVRSLGRDDDN